MSDADLTTALERRAETPEQRTVMDLIREMTPELEKATPHAITGERIARVALTEMRRVPKLMECDPRSFLGALMQATQLGLEPGPLGQVYLVPFGKQVTLIVGYKGMIDLAYRSGKLKSIATGTVREGDVFRFREGTRPVLDHEPAGPPGEREPTHYYAVAHTTTGGHPFKVLYPEDAEKARKASKATSPDSPWQTEYDAMARKTAVRRLAPMLPQSPVFAEALNVDETPAPPIDLDLKGEV